jgi:hypothetical protein
MQPLVLILLQGMPTGELNLTGAGQLTLLCGSDSVVCINLETLSCDCQVIISSPMLFITFISFTIHVNLDGSTDQLIFHTWM